MNIDNAEAPRASCPRSPPVALADGAVGLHLLWQAVRRHSHSADARMRKETLALRRGGYPYVMAVAVVIAGLVIWIVAGTLIALALGRAVAIADVRDRRGVVTRPRTGRTQPASGVGAMHARRAA